VSLAAYPVGAAVAVSDMERAREFYEDRLGLEPGTVTDDNRAYPCAGGTVIHVFLSPYAGTARATLAGWGVDDIERVVAELSDRGVIFEQYDEPPIVTDERGIAHFDGGAMVAYFKDPDGNTLSIAQVPAGPAQSQRSA
jgi:catechol 2,3-dioxygenase-like lactoylglutathione lyase family enzyme